MSCKLPGCNLPVYPETSFCGADHEHQYIRQQRTPSPAPSSSYSFSASKTCKLPGCNLPVSLGFEFCGRTHGQQYTSQQGSSSNSNSNSKTCKLPGCNLPVSLGFDFCGRTHGEQYTHQQSASSSSRVNQSFQSPFLGRILWMGENDRMLVETIARSKYRLICLSENQLEDIVDEIARNDLTMLATGNPSLRQTLFGIVKPFPSIPFHVCNPAELPQKIPVPEIKFYHRQDPYYEFTNFYEASFVLDGKQWKTSEHYFQAQKFAHDPRVVEFFRHLATPRNAFEEARKRNDVRRDWEDVKVGIMEKAVEAKFSQNPNLRTLLLRTGNARLIEHTINDKFWGDGGDGTGKNKLGEVLMKVRAKLSQTL